MGFPMGGLGYPMGGMGGYPPVPQFGPMGGFPGQQGFGSAGPQDQMAQLLYMLMSTCQLSLHQGLYIKRITNSNNLYD